MRSSWLRKCRVRQKPASSYQLTLSKDNLNERMLYVRSSKKGTSYVSWSIEADVFWRSPVDSSNECA